MHSSSAFIFFIACAVHIKAIYGFVLRLPCERAANFSVVRQSVVLQGSVIATFMFTTVSECQSHCLFKDGCQSINYQDHGEYVCELNNSTSEDVRYELGLTPRNGWMFMSTDHSYNLVGYNCQRYNPCPSGVLCTDICEVPGYKCHTCAPDQLGLDCQPAWRDCKDVMDAGYTRDGVYLINPALMQGSHFYVYCSFNLENTKAWNVIQRRVDGLVDFNRNWAEYEEGFGVLHSSFWLGLWKMHALTSRAGINMMLKVNIKSKKIGIKSGFARYAEFIVKNRTDSYQLHVASYGLNGSIGDSLTGELHGINGMKFSTFDQDNDISNRENCASKYGGGWWFSSCFSAFLNGLFPPENRSINCEDYNTQYMTWHSFNQCYGDVVYSEMKVRRG